VYNHASRGCRRLLQAVKPDAHHCEPGKHTTNKKYYQGKKFPIVLPIVLSLYPTFILKCQKWCDLNPSIPLDLQNQISFLERYELPKLTRLPISALMESALSAMDVFAQLNLLGRTSFDYSPDFRTLFVNFHRVFTNYYYLRSLRPNESFVADVLI
jgi:hypothetical protein